MPRKVIVLSEIKDGSIRNVSFEAIAAGKTIAQGGEVVALLLGESVAHLADPLFHYGADRVIVIEHENLRHYTSEGYSQALMEVIREEQPGGIVFGHTALGKDLSPKIATKLDSGLVSDVTQIEASGEDFLFTRPIYSGKAFEKKRIKEGILFITIRPNNIPPLEKDESRTGGLEKKNVEIKDLRTVIKEVVRKTSEGVDLTEAKVVVSGGRGVKSAEGFEPLKELAAVWAGPSGRAGGHVTPAIAIIPCRSGKRGKSSPPICISPAASPAPSSIWPGCPIRR